VKLAVIFGENERFLSNLLEMGFADDIVHAEKIVLREEFVEDFEMEIPKADIALAVDLHPDVLLSLPFNLEGYKALIVPIENPIPKGLIRQLERNCKKEGIELATPKPFCSFDPKEGIFKEFVDYFKIGRPKFDIELEKIGEFKIIKNVRVLRTQPCGMGRFVAEKLRGFAFKDLKELWLYLSEVHHSYPCTASMQVDQDYGDTLLHVSGFILRDEVTKALRI